MVRLYVTKMTMTLLTDSGWQFNILNIYSLSRLDLNTQKLDKSEQLYGVNKSELEIA